MIRIFLDPEFCREQSIRHKMSVNPFTRFAVRGSYDDQSYNFLREDMVKKLDKLLLFKSADTAHNADVVMMPFGHSGAKRKSPEIERHYRRIAEASGRPLIITKFGDSLEDVEGNNVIILRTSKYRSTLLPNEIICPPVSSDLGTETSLTILPKPKRPSIGFVGKASIPQSANSIRKYFKYGRRDHALSLLSVIIPGIGSRRSGLYFRTKAIHFLKQSEELDCNFIIRDFWGRRVKANVNNKHGALRAEFVDNIVQNVYTLCVRGAGNFSLRFFEVLSAGRIPLIIDTDLPLPMSEVIDYKKFCVFVDHSQLSDIGRLLVCHHSELDGDALEQMQQDARKTYNEKLRIDVFLKHLFSETLPAMI